MAARCRRNGSTHKSRTCGFAWRSVETGRPWKTRSVASTDGFGLAGMRKSIGYRARSRQARNVAFTEAATRAYTRTLCKDWYWLVEWWEINCHPQKLNRCSSSRHLLCKRLALEGILLNPGFSARIASQLLRPVKRLILRSPCLICSYIACV